MKNHVVLNIIVCLALSLLTCNEGQVDDTSQNQNTKDFSIIDFAPKTGGVGEEVIITGNFPWLGTGSAAVNILKVKVTFNGAEASIIQYSATFIKVQIPEHASSGKVIITYDGNTEETKDDFVFTTKAQATITSFEPKKAGVGTIIIINGTNFDEQPLSNIVTFSTATTAHVMGKVIEASPTRLKVAVPSGAVTGPIIVNPTNAILTSTAENFEAYPLELKTFQPSIGHPGSVINLIGEEFKENATVKINEIEMDATFINSGQITAIVPGQATSGSITITIDGITTTSTAEFVVIKSPVIHAITPMQGSVGTKVTISGSNFLSRQGSTQVYFNGKYVDLIESTDDRLVIEVPDGATTGKIIVYTNIVKTSDYQNEYTSTQSVEDFKVLQ